MANTVKDSAKTRKVAILAADGVDGKAVGEMKQLLTAAGVRPKVVAPRLGVLKAADSRTEISVDFSLLTVGSVLFDAVFIPGGSASVATLKGEARAVHFVHEAYKHCKALAAIGEGSELLPSPRSDAGPRDGKRGRPTEPGVIIGGDGQLGKVAEDFIAAIAQHRVWSREAEAERIPA